MLYFQLRQGCLQTHGHFTVVTDMTGKNKVVSHRHEDVDHAIHLQLDPCAAGGAASHALNPNLTRALVFGGGALGLNIK